MCGPSAAENGLQTSQINFLNTLQGENTEAFGESQGILSQLNGMFSGILSKGPNQEGFSPAELNSMNTEADTGVAENYRQAKQSLQEGESAQDGGNESVGAGDEDQLNAELASNAAATRSNQEQQITQNNYATGRQNFFNAAGELGSTAAQLNPNAFAANATGAGSAAETTANNIVQQQFSPYQIALGALGGIAGAAAGNMSFGGGGAPPAPSSGGGSGIYGYPEGMGD